ncbi:MAG TPA: DUF2567 domain-containing protein [Pseudonocardiaceae bacterium]|nr:DUF2567 domain-containing protein [Pseudonocardiaceae bacterium]
MAEQPTEWSPPGREPATDPAAQGAPEPAAQATQEEAREGAEATKGWRRATLLGERRPVELVDWPWAPVVRRPRVVVKADLLPALSLALLLAVFGLPLGWIWSRIAPPQRVGVSSDGQVLPLVDETYHVFDDIAVYLLMGLAFGIVAGVAVWLLRERRGPTVMFAAVLGAVGAGWLMTKTGVSFAAGQYTVPASLKIGTLFDIAPQLDTSWILLAPPLGVALAYLVLSAWSGTEDLGRRLG